MNNYDIVIGLEVHVQLATKTKIFCGCSAEFGGDVNSHTCPVCMAHPGTLPVLNKKVVDYAMAVGLATNCNISKVARFDRKNYFYPDNPQNYQISQLYMPLCTDGYIEIDEKLILNEEKIGNDKPKKKIGIHEIHMEEDAGKLIHDDEKGISLIDYNRAGVPLIEIVTKPDMASADEVVEFLDKLRVIIRYLQVSDCKLNEGSMRVDVNLSVKERGSKELGTRTEMKNLNSIKAIVRAIEHESNRQIELLSRGENVIQETRRWDDNKGCSYSMRSKEDANDYRYFPEPDVPELHISKEWIDNIRSLQPEFREEKKVRYKQEYNLPDYDIDIITSEIKLANIFEEVVGVGVEPKKVANWLMVDVFKILNDRGIEVEDIKFSAENLAALIRLVEDKKITKASGLEVLEELFNNPNTIPLEYVETHGLLMVDNTEELIKVIDEIFANNPKSIEDYHNGKIKAMGFLVGQTMKAMKGKAAPDIVNTIISQKLNS